MRDYHEFRDATLQVLGLIPAGLLSTVFPAPLSHHLQSGPRAAISTFSPDFRPRRKNRRPAVSRLYKPSPAGLSCEHSAGPAWGGCSKDVWLHLGHTRGEMQGEFRLVCHVGVYGHRPQVIVGSFLVIQGLTELQVGRDQREEQAAALRTRRSPRWV